MKSSKKTHIKTYSELIQYDSFEDRYNYLKLNGDVGIDTFGFDRYLNQIFYRSKEWLSLRNQIIIRDNGCDLGVDGYEIFGKIIIHHMNPISVDDILSHGDFLLNPEFLISTTMITHNGLHYGSEKRREVMPVTRTPNDMCPWKTNR